MKTWTIGTQKFLKEKTRKKFIYEMSKYIADQAERLWKTEPEIPRMEVFLQITDLTTQCTEAFGNKFNVKGTDKKELATTIISAIFDSLDLNFKLLGVKIPNFILKPIMKKIILNLSSKVIDYIVSLYNKTTNKLFSKPKGK